MKIGHDLFKSLTNQQKVSLSVQMFFSVFVRWLNTNIKYQYEDLKSVFDVKVIFYRIEEI